MYGVWTVLAQWASGQRTEFEVDAGSANEARLEGERELAERYPPGGRITAVRRGMSLTIWDKLVSQERSRKRELQGPPREWYRRLVSPEQEKV